jgi:hypothetical protein
MTVALSQTSASIYYSTFARYWEFGLGSICSILWFWRFDKKINRQWRSYLVYLSVAVFILSFVVMENQNFGVEAIFPLSAVTIYTLLNLSESSKGFFLRILKSRFFQFLGDIAFPLYLLHWPAMVLLKSSGLTASLINILGYLAIVIFASYLLHKYFEIPILKIDLSRYRRSNRQKSGVDLQKDSLLKRKISISVLILSFSLVFSFGNTVTLKQAIDSTRSYLSKDREENLVVNLEEDLEDTIPPTVASATPSASGSSQVREPNQPQAVDPPRTVESEKMPGVKTSPNPEETKPSIERTWLLNLVESSKMKKIPPGYETDQAEVYLKLRKSWSSTCLNSLNVDTACVFGAGGKEAVLVGDSFSYALLGGLRKAMPPGWSLRVLTRGSCLPWDVAQYSKNNELNTSCDTHSRWVNEYIKIRKPDLVIATGADQWLKKSTLEEWKDGFERTASAYAEHATKLIVISTAPGSGNLNECIELNDSLLSCFGYAPRISTLLKIQQQLSTKLNYEFINLVDYLCFTEICPPIIHNMPVYADGSHISGMFSAKLSEVFRARAIFS